MEYLEGAKSVSEGLTLNCYQPIIPSILCHLKNVQWQDNSQM